MTETETKLEALAKKYDRLEQAVDELRRRAGLSPVIDDQLIAIEARRKVLS